MSRAILDARFCEPPPFCSPALLCAATGLSYPHEGADHYIVSLARLVVTCIGRFHARYYLGTHVGGRRGCLILERQSSGASIVLRFDPAETKAKNN